MTKHLLKQITALTLCLCMLLAYIPAAQAATLAISRQPANVAVVAGKTASTSVAATGEGLTYRWYYKDAGSSVYSASSATSSTYSLVMKAAYNGRRVYCRVTDKYGNVVNSNSALLTVATPAKITRQPANVTTTAGKTATVSVAATGDGLTYRWYYKDAGSSTYAKSSVTTSTYSLVMKAAYNGRRVYCRVTDKYGNVVNSNSALLTVATPVKITKQPANAATASGRTVTVSVSAAGDGLSYRWYYAEAGRENFYKSSVTTASYSLLMNIDRDGRRVYCVVTDKYGNTATSSTVTLSRIAPPRITTQPADVVVASGRLASVSVTAEGDGLKYLWYYKDLADSAFSRSSVTTDTYSIYMNDARDGRQVYCVVTDQYGQKKTSDTVTLSMPWAIRIAEQPTDAKTYAGMTAEVTVAAEGEGLTYRWYYADAGSETFYKSSVTTPAYSLVMSAARDGRRVYCEIVDQYGQKATTSTVTLSMLASDYVPEGLAYSIENDAVTITGYTGGMEKLVIPSEIEGYPVRKIGSDAFYGSSILTSITIPNNVTSIGDRAFYDCYRLTSITLSNSLTSIGYSAFDSCRKLASITLPNSLTSIGGAAFDNCQKLTSITIPDSVTSIGASAFHGCTSLRSITLPNGLTSISDYMFDGCTSLRSVTLPDGVTSIGAEAFQECIRLSSVTLSDSLTSIGSYAFDDCTSLGDMTLPDGVTSIGMYAFWECTSMTSITLPSSVMSIGTRAFDGLYAEHTFRVKNKSYAHQWCLDHGYEDQLQLY